MDIQALFFDATMFSLGEAKDWCGEHGFEPVEWRSKLDDDEVKTHHIAVMFQPDEAVEGSFKTISDDFPDGISATVAERQEKSMEVRHIVGKQSAADPFEFIMSDETVDRMGDIIEARGWNLQAFKSNPIALFGHDHDKVIGTWDKVRVEGKRLIGKLKLAARGTSQLVDEMHALIEQRILKAVSVGFQPEDYEEIKDKDGKWTGGYRFLKQSLLECSLVSVPANPSALSLAKSLEISDATRRLVFEPEEKGRSLRARQILETKSAHPGLTTPLKPNGKDGTKMSIAERIKAKEERLVAIKDRLTELKGLIESDDEYELSEDEQTEIETLSAEEESVLKSLESLRKIEKGLAAKAVSSSGAPAGRQTAPAQAAKKELGGSLLVKTITAHLISHITKQPVGDIISEVYGSDERVAAVNKVYGNRRRLIQKSGVDAADTTTTGWAAELVQNDLRGFLEELRAVSVYAQLLAAPGAMSLDFGGANSITIPNRNKAAQSSGAATGLAAAAHLGAQIGGAWVGEGGVIPVKQLALSSQTLNRYKMAVISAMTNEIIEQSTPSIEGIVRAAILEDTALAVDGALLDGAAAVAGIRPASPFNGAATTASAGATAANIITDLKYLLGQLSAINGASPVLIMNSNRLLGLSTVTTAAGGFMFRDDIAAGRLLGVPVIASTTVNPATVGIIDASSFVGANDAPAFAISDQATLTMANADGTAPTQAGAATDHTGGALGTAEQVPVDGGIIVTGDTAGAPAGASVAGYQAQSMWQQYQTAIRMVMPASWGMVRTGASAYLTGVAW